MIAILVILLTLASFESVLTNDPDEGLNTVQLIENHGYPCESHTITTEDGYILTYHRIPHGLNDDSDVQRPVAFLMHGLSASSADYVNMGTNRSLGFILADDGYDVWLGNSRGNAWARNHTTLDVVTDAQQFFDFSWHEIGYYDLPAAIDYILNVNGGDSLYYIGHSMGSTSFLVLGSTRPEYNSKIKVASLMAPVSFMENVTNERLLNLGQNIYELEALGNAMQMYEIPFVDQLRAVGAALCPLPGFVDLCEEIIFSVVGEDQPELDTEKLGVLFTNLPSNAAMKPNYHYGQQIKNGGFHQYDLGAEKNLEVYGTETPPSYDLSKLTAPVAVYYGKNDPAANVENSQTLISNLPNVANDYLVPHELFNHLDFTYAIDVVELLYDELIGVMEKY